MQQSNYDRAEDQDLILVQRLAGREKGWHSAFSELYLAYQDSIQARCRVLLGNDDDAQDITQEVFLRVLRFVDRFDARSSLKTWLLKIAENLCFSLLKQRQRQRQLQRQAQVTVPAEIGAEDSGLLKAVDIEQQQHVAAMMRRIDRADRELLGLRFWCGCTLPDIATMLGLQLSACKMRLARLLDRCRIYMQALHFVPACAMRSIPCRSADMRLSGLRNMHNYTQNGEKS